MLLFALTLWESSMSNLKAIAIFLLLLLFSSNLFAKENNYLLNTSLHKNQLKFIFKYNIDHVKFFTLKNKGVIKYVYDVKNAVLPRSQYIKQYRHSSVLAFRMGQFSKTHLRIVVESKKTHYHTYSIHGKVLTLNLPRGKKGASVYIANSQKTPLQGKKRKINRYSPTVIIDAGHGGRDIGASWQGIIEKHITLKMALKARDMLVHRGYKVYMTRDRDKTLTLRQRTDLSNAKKANIFVSIHTNAAPKRRKNYIYKGIEVYYLRGTSRRTRYSNRKIYTSNWKKNRSYKLCKLIKSGMLKNVRKKHIVIDKGIKKNNFWVLRGTRAPSILIEAGYITDKYEGKRLTQNAYQNGLAQGVVDGVDAYFGRL